MKKEKTSEYMRSEPPAYSREAREQQLLAKAEALVEKQIDEGTISATVLAEIIRRGSTKFDIERDILREQKEHLAAKTEAIKSAERIEKLFEEATRMFKVYHGSSDESEDEIIP